MKKKSPTTIIAKLVNADIGQLLISTIKIIFIFKY